MAKQVLLWSAVAVLGSASAIAMGVFVGVKNERSIGDRMMMSAVEAHDDASQNLRLSVLMRLQSGEVEMAQELLCERLGHDVVVADLRLQPGTRGVPEFRDRHAAFLQRVACATTVECPFESDVAEILSEVRRKRCPSE